MIVLSFVQCKQESIKVNSVPRAPQPYVLRWPLVVSTSGVGGGPQVNKFEKVSSNGHQISLGGGKAVGERERHAVIIWKKIRVPTNLPSLRPE